MTIWPAIDPTLLPKASCDRAAVAESEVTQSAAAFPSEFTSVPSAVYAIDPLSDSRWAQLLKKDSRASIFHTPEWLEALRRSYGFTPIVFTTSPPGHELTNGIAFCGVDSWLTGRRLISVPFADHCEPIVDHPQALADIVAFVGREVVARRMKYAELRPLATPTTSPGWLATSALYYFHVLDLRPSVDQLYRRLHKDCVRRKIRKAERANLTYESGNTHDLLERFYPLFVMTRRRHGLPPSPIHWLRNLLDCLRDSVEIRIASRDGVPIAGMVTLSHGNTTVYKYGGSDLRHSHLGAMAYLFWRTMLDAKEAGRQFLDLGRCEIDNPGLITYKDRWGTLRSEVRYARVPGSCLEAIPSRRQLQIASRLFASVPDCVRVVAGNLLYRHVG
jgi:hypothetical protein